jgi:deferrochelatase/peroxidase EfeB
MVVGRFRDGRPLIANANSASPTQNDFNFSSDEGRNPTFCPAHAHIRKSNPRDNRRVGDRVRERQIARRGITYGIDIQAGAAAVDSGSDVGLLFMCYQASIARQFEFIHRSWTMDDRFPTNGIGLDPVAANNDKVPQLWRSAQGEAIRFSFSAVVEMCGGEYFFAPSMPFLLNLRQYQSPH